jgi:hypothetical protein
VASGKGALRRALSFLALIHPSPARHASGPFSFQEPSGIGQIGYDRTMKRCTEYWIDNMGTAATYLFGKSDDGGKTITFAGKMTSPSTSNEVDTRWVHTHRSDDEFTFEIFFGPKDKEVQVLELTYKRAK